MKIRITTWMLTIPAMALLLAGCATSFPQDRLEKISAFPTVTTLKTVYIDLAFTGELNGEPWTLVDEYNTKYLKQTCIQHMNDSRMFGEISTTSKDADLLVYAAVINSREADPFRERLMAWTLAIVPFKSTDTFHLQALVKNTATGEEQMIRLTESVNHWQELFMAPLALFSSPKNAMKESRARLFDNLCMEIQKAGLLN